MEHSRSLVRVTTEPLDERELTAFVATPASGGVVLFSGVVRNEHEGREVTGIGYTAADELARAQLERVAAEALEDPDVHRVAAFHRTGELAVGEASVMVAASAAHREAAFRAARRLIDRIKEAVPVWKHEHFADGASEWAPGFTVAPEDHAHPASAPGGPSCS